jgi:hypothetical protein
MSVLLLTLIIGSPHPDEGVRMLDDERTNDEWPHRALSELFLLQKCK